MAAGIPEFRNLVELQRFSAERYRELPSLGTKKGGRWVWTTYGELGELAERFRGGLASLGVGAGDGVAIIANNRVEWVVAAHATYGLGARYIPMYEKQHPDDWAYIIGDSGAKVVVTANGKIAAQIRPLLEELGTLEAVVDLDGGEDDPHSYRSLLAKGAEAPAEAIDPDPEMPCGLIYTSGTTGKPKGVVLSHRNIASNVNAVMALFDVSTSDRSVSFLPWAHSFGQTCELHIGTAFGASSAICDDVTRLSEYLAEVRPSMLLAVPRVFNTVYDNLNKRIAAEGGLKKLLFGAAMANAARRRELAEQGRRSLVVELKHRVFDRLVFSKVRARLGGRLRFAMSGGAAISKEVATFIDDLGVKVYEGYGLSETSPIATANHPGAHRIGSVGKPIVDVEIIIDRDAVGGTGSDEGEVLIKGPNVMLGYHNLPDETAAVMREDGAFRSGDIGRIDADGYLYITGRIKEQYKLENGKYVVPAPLEEQLQLSGFIAQAMVYGENRPRNVALIVPDMEAVRGWARERGIATDSDEELLAGARVRELIEDEIAKRERAAFKGFERVRNFRLLAEEFSVDNEMLTPTLKLKRRKVIAHYQALLEEMYGEE